MEVENTYKIIILCALSLGSVFGFITQKIRFCVLGAISDALLYKNFYRVRIWLVAVLTAAITTQALILNNIISPASSIFINNKVLWLSNILGGICFGFGMALASGCGSRALIRVGEGNLKALIVLIVMSFSALVTLKGILAPVRVNFFEKVNFSIGSYSDLVTVSSYLISNENIIRQTCIWIMVIILFLVFFTVFNKKNSNMNSHSSYFLSMIIGILVTGGWFVTGNIGFLGEHPDTLEFAHVATNSNSIESFTFVGPIAYLSELLMYWSDSSKKVSFGISIVIGTVFGSLISSKLTKTFRLEGFNSSTDFFHHVVGGVLMGIGGVFAVGCSIGHGLSGLSLLSIGSIITVASLWLGTFLGLEYIHKRA